MVPCYLVLGAAGFPGKIPDCLLSPRFCGPLPEFAVLPHSDPEQTAARLKAWAGREIRVLCLESGNELPRLLALCREAGVRSFLLLRSGSLSGSLALSAQDLAPAGKMAFLHVFLTARLLGPGAGSGWPGALLGAHIQGRLRVCPRGCCEVLDVRELGRQLMALLCGGSSGFRVIRGQVCSFPALLAMVRPLGRKPPVFLPPGLLLRLSPPDFLREACLEALEKPITGPQISQVQISLCRALSRTVGDMVPGLLSGPDLTKKP